MRVDVPFICSHVRVKSAVLCGSFLYLYLYYTLYMAGRQCKGIDWEGCVMWGLLTGSAATTEKRIPYFFQTFPNLEFHFFQTPTVAATTQNHQQCSTDHWFLYTSLCLTLTTFVSAWAIAGHPLLQCIQAKISKTLDKRSTLIFGANCTEQKLSSSESYHLSPNL